ncbi:MAG: flavoprotein, partial [Halobacteria archaeon]|nr:flavoprotein [Halobacteria archaeon]
GELYVKKLRDEGLFKKLQPTRYKISKALGEHDIVTSINDAILKSPVGRFAVRALGGSLEGMFSSPFLSTMAPVTLPTVIAEELGDEIDDENTVEPKSLLDRIGDLTYDTDVGNPHIIVEDESFDASGAAVWSCPVSARDFGGGCYRDEKVESNGGEEHVVSLDTQPCIECGTCAVVADTEWRHPRGGKGVDFKQG